MKKIFIVFIISISCIALSLVLSACDGCGKDKTAERHRHEYVPTVTEPTCTMQGRTTYTCGCGSSYVSDYTDPLGHEYVGDICARCGWIRHDHIYENTTVEPDCTAQGYTQGVCSICGATYKTDFVDPLGHDYDNGTCRRCGSFNPDEHVHDYMESTVEADCVNGGYTLYSCNCGYSYTDGYTSPLGHNHVQGKCVRCGDIAATDGLKYTLHGTYYSCSGIGTAKDTDIIIAPEYNGKPVNDIDENAFKDCTRLTSITMYDSIYNIGKNAFNNCSSLESITLSNGVTYINFCVFEGCSSLKSIALPKRVSRIAGDAFRGCDSLESITVSEENTSYTSKNNCLIDRNKTLVLGCKNSVIPDDGSVDTVGNGAFWGCKGLTSITIPESVTTIESYAFSYCENLATLTVPNGVTSVSKDAFYNCDKIENLTAPVTILSKINRAALKTVDITDGEIILRSTFSLSHSLTSVKICDSVTTIESYAFEFCGELKSVTIGKGLTSIARQAFAYCYNLGDIYFDGTREQWDSISKGSEWDYGAGRKTSAGTYLVHCSDDR